MKKFCIVLFVIMVSISFVSSVGAASKALKVWEYPLDSGCLNTMLLDDAKVVRVIAEQEYDDVIPCPPCIPEPVPIAAPAPIVAPEKDPVLFVVYFDFDKSDIKKPQLSIIDAVVKYMADNPGAKTIVSEGHCDNRGSDKYNCDLGMRRAISVKNALVAKGIDTNIIDVDSYGESDTISDMHWENRRVYIIIK